MKEFFPKIRSNIVSFSFTSGTTNTPKCIYRTGSFDKRRLPKLTELYQFGDKDKFLVIGFFLSGTWALIHKIRRRGEPEEEEYLPPEEYAEPEESNSKPQRPVIKIALRVVIIAVILCGIFLDRKSVV